MIKIMLCAHTFCLDLRVEFSRKFNQRMWQWHEWFPEVRHVISIEAINTKLNFFIFLGIPFHLNWILCRFVVNRNTFFCNWNLNNEPRLYCIWKIVFYFINMLFQILSISYCMPFHYCFLFSWLYFCRFAIVSGV